MTEEKPYKKNNNKNLLTRGPEGGQGTDPYLYCTRKMLFLWQCSNPIDKTPIGDQGAGIVILATGLDRDNILE